MEVVLGENVKETTNGDGRTNFKTIRDTFQYVPLIPVLERLLNQYDVYVQVSCMGLSHDWHMYILA